MPLNVAGYAALTANVYHFSDQDQQLQLDQIGVTRYVIPIEFRAGLTAAGFLFAPDGFVYTARGLGDQGLSDGDIGVAGVRPTAAVSAWDNAAAGKPRAVMAILEQQRQAGFKGRPVKFRQMTDAGANAEIIPAFRPGGEGS